MSAGEVALWFALVAALAAAWWQYRAEEARADRWEGEALLWKRRAAELGEQVYRLSVQLEEADAPLATIHHLPQAQRVYDVLAANEAKRHLTDARLDEALETWSDGGDAS